MRPVGGLSGEALARAYRRRRIRQVSAMLFVYAIFYICRLAFSASKKDMIEQGAYTAKEIGVVGSAMLIAYAIGKFVNGFVADRVNVRRYIMFGLFVSAMANFIVGFHVPALMLAVVWFVNGLAQSTGAPCCVVALSRWWPKERRGTYYGIWSCSNNLGEVLAYILTAGVMVWAGATYGADYAWRSCFWGASAMGAFGIAVAWLFFGNAPEDEGLPPVPVDAVEAKVDTSGGQKIALMTPAVWLIAIAGGLFAASRYAVIDWGIVFLQVKKGYSGTDAAMIVTVNSIVGAVSSGLSGIVSDRLFKGSRQELAVSAGLMNVTALVLFMLLPGRHPWLDVTAMVLRSARRVRPWGSRGSARISGRGCSRLFQAVSWSVAPTVRRSSWGTPFRAVTRSIGSPSSGSALPRFPWFLPLLRAAVESNRKRRTKWKSTV